MRKQVLSAVLAFVGGVAIGAGSLVWAQSSTDLNLGHRSSGQQAVGQTFTITTDASGKVRSSTEAKPVTLGNESLGLRVVGERRGRLVGTLVAKVNGQWIDVQFAPQDVLAGR